MGIFSTSAKYWCGGFQYDIDANVFARDSHSAQAQMSWLTGNVHCMCRDCVDSWKRDYSVYIDSLPDRMPKYDYCSK